MKNSPVEWLTLLFNGIIAVVALIGFTYTIFSNKDISKTLETIKNTFETYTDPILKFEDFTWLYGGSKGQKMDCANPPFGINFKYKNNSNFPIKILINKLSVIYESTDFYQMDGEGSEIYKKEIILASQSTYGFTVAAGDDFRSIFKKKGGIYSGPFLEIHFEGIISNLSETKKFKINLVDHIGFDCKQLGIKNIINYKSTYSQL